MSDKNEKSIFDMLALFLRGSKRYFLTAVVAAVFSIVFNFLTPQILRFAVDDIIGGRSSAFGRAYFGWLTLGGGRRGILVCTAAILVCAALSALFNFLTRACNARGNEIFSKKMRDTLFRHIEYLPYKWHMEHRTGDIIQRCVSDVQTVREFVAIQFMQLIRILLLVAVAVALMFSMNGPLALMAAAFIPVIALYSAFFRAKLMRLFRKADESEGDLMTCVQENLTGVRVVRAFGRERFELDKFDSKLNSFTNKWIDLGYATGFFWGIGDFVSDLQLLVVTCAGAYMASRGRLTAGEFIAFETYIVYMQWPVRGLGRVVSEFSKAGVSLNRLKEILDAPLESDAPEALKPEMRADIRFEDVSFSYGGQKVLDHLTFTAPRGKMTGILGSTGSGKSTLLYLLDRLYELPEGCGRITVGGVDIRNIDRKWLRQHIGLVLQEPFLFSKTVAENIAVTSHEPDMARIRRSAETADVADDISEFSAGYDTMVGERGVTLSGGQAQRIAIARTLMMNCPVYAFDDSMSAVDMETDARINSALRQGTGDATVILISHRVSTLMKADRIVVIEDGRVAEEGTHEELMARGGLYAKTYDIQAGFDAEEGAVKNA